MHKWSNSDKPACASTQNAGTFYIQFHEIRFTDTLIYKHHHVQLKFHKILYIGDFDTAQFVNLTLI